MSGELRGILDQLPLLLHTSSPARMPWTPRPAQLPQMPAYQPPQVHPMQAPPIHHIQDEPQQQQGGGGGGGGMDLMSMAMMKELRGSSAVPNPQMPDLKWLAPSSGQLQPLTTPDGRQIGGGKMFMPGPSLDVSIPHMQQPGFFSRLFG